MKTLLSAVVGATLALCAIEAVAQAEERAEPARKTGRLSDALNEWARVNDIRLVSPDWDFVEELSAPEVRGASDARAVLDRLLAGAPLTYTWLGDRAVSIRRKVVPAPSAAPERPPEPVADVIVTGSRMPQVEGLQDAVPATKITRERLRELGVTSIADGLNYLPQQSFSFPDGATFASTRTVQLRGLGVGNTLVLIDGQRVAPSALTTGVGSYFDLNTVPLPAVKRIEVISGSGSAIYGADAVGGVVNIVLDKSIDRPVVDLYQGEAKGGGRERRASLALGASGERARATLVVDAYDREALFGRDRSLLANNDYRAFGLADRRLPFANLGNVLSATGDNLPGLPCPVAAVPAGSSGVGMTPADFLATACQQNMESFGKYSEVVSEVQRLSVLGTLEVDITADVIGFAQVLYSDLESPSTTSPPGASALVPATNPYNPFGEPVIVVRLLTEIKPITTINETQPLRASTGLRGALAGWDWEVTLSGSTEHSRNYSVNDVDAERVQASLFETDAARSLNLFTDGPAGDRALLDSLVAPPHINRFSSNYYAANAFVGGSLWSMGGGAARTVVGVEQRSESVRMDSSLLDDVDRDVTAVFAELALPLLAGAAGGERLTATLAARYDRYSDFGSSFNPQVRLAWQMNDDLLFRGSYGTGFRPPSLFELNSPPFIFPTVTSDPRRNNQLTLHTVVAGGNADLDAEQSHSADIGIVYTPSWLPGYRISSSYWRITQDQRVRTFGPDVVLTNEATFPERIVRAAPTAADVAAGQPGRLLSIDSTLINFGRLETSGIDLDVTASFGGALGAFTPRLAATWVDRYQTSDLPGAPTVDRVGIANTQGTIPRWRATGSLLWQLRGVSLSTTLRYTSAYDDADVMSGGTLNGRRVASQTLADAQVGVAFGDLLSRGAGLFEGLTLRVGAENVFDERPALSEIGTVSAFDVSQADLRQRFVYVALSKEF